MKASRITSPPDPWLGYPVWRSTGTKTIFEGTEKSSLGGSSRAWPMKWIQAGSAARDPVFLVAEGPFLIESYPATGGQSGVESENQASV